MRRDVAERIVPKLAKACSLIGETVEDLRATADSHELRAYALLVSNALAAVQLDMMRPIFAEFPDLNPYSADRRSRTEKAAKKRASRSKK